MKTIVRLITATLACGSTMAADKARMCGDVRAGTTVMVSRDMHVAYDADCNKTITGRGDPAEVRAYEREMEAKARASALAEQERIKRASRRAEEQRIHAAAARAAPAPVVAPRPRRVDAANVPHSPPPSAGVINVTNGQFMPRVAGGIIDPRNGTFHQEVAGGFVNSKTGQFSPKF